MGEKKYRLARDAKGHIVCFDEDGKQAPLSRCVSIGVGDDADEISIKIRKSCIVSRETREQVVGRLMSKGETVWAITNDNDEEWEGEL